MIPSGCHNFCVIGDPWDDGLRGWLLFQSGGQRYLVEMPEGKVGAIAAALKCGMAAIGWHCLRECGSSIRQRKEIRMLALSGIRVEVSVFHGR